MERRDEERVHVEVVQRVIDTYAASSESLENAIFDTIYEERRRLETERDENLKRSQSKFYDRIYSEALHADSARHRELLREIVSFFGHEVAGHFDERVYKLATTVIPSGLGLLLNGTSPLKLANALPSGFRNFDERLDILGETEQLQRLAKRGTVVMAPTHVSNLDSIVMGYAIYRLGLPPHLYGAGLNLFSNSALGFFMRNLGAYTVDRRKKAAVYKNVLKTYAGVAMELGYHSLFFPGGTRSRSGAVEKRLKLGLLGMGLDAYVHNLLDNKPNPDVYVVPCTINYELVLEAETLIDDYLKEAGKSRYIIDDDEFSRPKLVLDFVRKLLALNARIQIVVGQPLDPFGNKVDQDGRSLDYRGRPIDRAKFVMRNGQPTFDAQRDHEYTRELASSIVDSFRRNTLAKTTSVIARSMFTWLREEDHDEDLYRLLRAGGAHDSIRMSDMIERTERLVANLKAREQRGELMLDASVKDRDAPDLISAALAYLGSYHKRPAIQRRGDRVYHVDRNLLYYYQNRIDWLGAEEGGAQ